MGSRAEATATVIERSTRILKRHLQTREDIRERKRRGKGSQRMPSRNSVRRDRSTLIKFLLLLFLLLLLLLLPSHLPLFVQFLICRSVSGEGISYSKPLPFIGPRPNPI